MFIQSRVLISLSVPGVLLRKLMPPLIIMVRSGTLVALLGTPLDSHWLLFCSMVEEPALCLGPR